MLTITMLINGIFISVMMAFIFAKSNDAVFFKWGYSDTFKFMGMTIDSLDKYIMFILILAVDRTFGLIRASWLWVSNIYNISQLFLLFWITELRI